MKFLLNRAYFESQMTAAKVVDVIAPLRRLCGQAADAVSASTQVKMEDAPRPLRIPRSECHDVWIRHPRHKWQKSWTNIEDPVVSHLNEMCTDTHLLVSCGRVNLKNFCQSLDRKKCTIGIVYLFTENKDYSFRSMWTTSKWLEGSRKWLPCGRN